MATELSDKDPRDSMESRPHLTLEQVMEHVFRGTVKMIETRKVPVNAFQSHPQDISSAELETLRDVLVKLVHAQQKIKAQSSLQDLPLKDVFTSEDTVRVFQNKGIRSVMDLRHYDIERLPTVFTYALSLGGATGKHQLHMFLFVDDHA